MRRRLAWSPLVPRFSVRFLYGQTLGEFWEQGGPRPAGLELNNHVALRWEIRATWDLERLVFDGRELRVTALRQHLVRQRQDLLERVARAYSQWRNVRARLAADTGSLSVDQRDELKEELAQRRALLEVLTGGLLAREGIP
ncbi:MAG: hypothetical protein IT371_02345 [Deltaproteobacteria bacterium]|nr:hypothetical protein [Deltaproteobacteria bacterium]